MGSNSFFVFHRGGASSGVRLKKGFLILPPLWQVSLNARLSVTAGLAMEYSQISSGFILFRWESLKVFSPPFYQICSKHHIDENESHAHVNKQVSDQAVKCKYLIHRKVGHHYPIIRIKTAHLRIKFTNGSYGSGEAKPGGSQNRMALLN